jgi:FkbM family methyltransferase
VKLSVKSLVKRTLQGAGLDVRRTSSAYTLVEQLGLLLSAVEDSVVDRQAGQRLLSGLIQFLDAGVRPHGQLLQDAFAVGARLEPGYFVEVGAGHPHELSNVDRLIGSFGWTGIRIDPNPEFAVLHRSQELKGVEFVEAAIGRSDRTTMELLSLGELSSRVDLARSDHHGSVRAKALKSGRVTTVPVRRLDSLMDELGCPRHIQYLSVDTEGAEAEVLETFPFATTDVDVVTIEHNFRPEGTEAIDRILSRWGYVRVLRFVSAWDAWYVKDPTQVEGPALR